MADVDIDTKFGTDPIGTVVDADRVPVGKADASSGVALWSTIRSYLQTSLSLAASRITSGTFAEARIPDLSATYQPLDADLTALAGLSSADGNVIVGSGAGWVAESGATARASLGLTIGTDVAAASHTHALADVTDSGDLAALDTVGTTEIDDAAVTYAKMQDVSATDRLLGRSTTGAGPVEEIVCTAAGRALLDDANNTAQRTTLGLAIGSDVQAWDADLDTWATKTPPSGDPVGTTDTQALTNKDISGATNTYRAASDSVTGAVELATTAETTTGTDSARAVTPDALAGSVYGTEVVTVCLFDDSEDVATGDGAGDQLFRVPSTMNGWNLVAVAAYVQTAGTTGTTDVQVHNVTQAADMLSTKLTIDTGETDSATAATPAVIDGTNDDVATGDKLRFDVDAVSTTAPKGLWVELQFRAP